MSSLSDEELETITYNNIIGSIDEKNPLQR